MQLTTLSKKEHRGVISLPRKGDSWNWVEDVWEQVRHCVDCLEPMMLSDYMNKNGYKHQDSLNYKYNWIGNVYIDGGKHDESGYSYCDKCSNRQYRWKKDNEAKPYADTNHKGHPLTFSFGNTKLIRCMMKDHFMYLRLTWPLEPGCVQNTHLHVL